MESIAPLKRCTKCGVEKPLDCFYKERRRNGYRPRCKDCFLADDLAYRHQRLEEINAKRRAKYAANGDGVKDRKKAYAEQHRDEIKARTKTWAEANKERLKALALARFRANPEAKREYGRRYYAEHSEEKRAYWHRYRKANYDKIRVNAQTRREREDDADGNYTPKEFRDLCAKYGNRCLRCGRDDVGLTADHVLPLSKGGSNGIDNIQPLCKPCNSSKHAKYVDYRSGTPVYQPPLL